MVYGGEVSGNEASERAIADITRAGRIYIDGEPVERSYEILHRVETSLNDPHSSIPIENRTVIRGLVTAARSRLPSEPGDCSMRPLELHSDPTPDNCLPDGSDAVPSYCDRRDLREYDGS